MAVAGIILGIVGIAATFMFGIWGLRQANRRQRAVREVHGALTFAEGLLHGLKAGASPQQVIQIDDALSRLSAKATEVSSL